MQEARTGRSCQEERKLARRAAGHDARLSGPGKKGPASFLWEGELSREPRCKPEKFSGNWNNMREDRYPKRNRNPPEKTQKGKDRSRATLGKDNKSWRGLQAEGDFFNNCQGGGRERKTDGGGVKKNSRDHF